MKTLEEAKLISLATLDLPAKVVSKLLDAGYKTAACVMPKTPTDLDLETELSWREVRKLEKVLKKNGVGLTKHRADKEHDRQDTAWATVQEGETERLERLPVNMGWLYRSRSWGDEAGPTESMTFVPGVR